MAEKLRLTVACGDYEIVRALKEGTVAADGLDLVMLQDMGSKERHWRMARKREFDVCEINVGAYFMARDRGEALTAIPVFLHRRFRHGFIFVNAAAGIREPKDLAGKRIGGTNFQPSSNIWMRGILEEEHGFAHRSATWVVEREEDVPFTVPEGLRIEMIAPGQQLDLMLAEGEIPAMLSPTLPRRFVEGDRRIVRLFPEFFRSCTSRRSSRRSSTAIHGSPSISPRPSRPRRPSRTAASPIRASSRSRGSGARGRSRKRCSVRTPGPMGSTPPTAGISRRSCATRTGRDWSAAP
jgi:hypothetical protein